MVDGLIGMIGVIAVLRVVLEYVYERELVLAQNKVMVACHVMVIMKKKKCVSCLRIVKVRRCYCTIEWNHKEV